MPKSSDQERDLSPSEPSDSQTGLSLLAGALGVIAIIRFMSSGPSLGRIAAMAGGSLVVGLAFWLIAHLARTGKISNTTAQVIVVGGLTLFLVVGVIVGELRR